MKHKNKKLSSVKSILKLLQHLQVIHYGKAYVDVNYLNNTVSIACRKNGGTMVFEVFNEKSYDNNNICNYKNILNTLNNKSFNYEDYCYGNGDNKSLKAILSSVHKIQLEYYNTVRISITTYPTDTVEVTVYSKLYPAKSFSFGHYSKDTYDTIYNNMIYYCEYINNSNNETSNS